MIFTLRAAVELSVIKTVDFAEIERGIKKDYSGRLALHRTKKDKGIPAADTALDPLSTVTANKFSDIPVDRWLLGVLILSLRYLPKPLLGGFSLCLHPIRFPSEGACLPTTR